MQGFTEETIAAISTPLGEGGLAIIRISGPEAIAIGDKVFRPVGEHSEKPSQAGSHTVHYGKIVRDGQVIDEVMLTVLRAPRTATREDMIEISGHGGILVVKKVLDAVLAAGARLAQPGEFTKRAFLSGRIDLTQAEAVADLIHSRTDLALTAANEQLAGKLAKRIRQLRDEMLKVLAHVEAHIDFPDEDIAPDTKEQLLDRLRGALGFMGELLSTAQEGQILRRGFRAAIVGRPNAGKSSLLNQLLGSDRAIVSPVAGTTRDTIEETTNIRGLPIVFIDTAGLRESGDALELEGMRRSRQSLERAELILHILDVSEELTAEDVVHLREFAAKKRLIVRNKIDLPARLKLPDIAGARVVSVSCETGEGIESLKDAIKELIWAGEIRAEMLQVMINSRHQEALERARQGTERAINALEAGSTLELVALDLRLATNAVGEIVGQTSTEDLLDSIFSQFCLGK